MNDKLKVEKGSKKVTIFDHIPDTVVVVKNKEHMGYDECETENMVFKAFDEYIADVYKTKDISKVIVPGSKVVIKPNLVHELNFLVSFDGQEMDNPNDCFITNWNVIRAIVKYLSKIDNLQISIIECPIQSCDLNKLVDEKKIDDLRALGNSSVEFIDARRTRYYFADSENNPRIIHDLRSKENYVYFDLGNESEHAPYDKYVDRFRVTDYPPSEMKKFHRKGFHQYCIAKEIIEADYVISVPKLKTHMKAGMTGAMKNMIGVVGNKECLPHHTKGAPIFGFWGGDCYGHFSLLKTIAEKILDSANENILDNQDLYYKKWKIINRILTGLRVLCFDDDISGSWYGNDTICRTIVDLNKLVYYGDLNGNLKDTPQRKVISLVDAIVSGQGEGPMRPTPNHTGFICVGESTAGVDCVCAELIGLDSYKIGYLGEERTIRKKYGLRSPNNELNILINGEKVAFSKIQQLKSEIKVPLRWQGRIEKEWHGCKFNYFTNYFMNFKKLPQNISEIQELIRHVWEKLRGK